MKKDENKFLIILGILAIFLFQLQSVAAQNISELIDPIFLWDQYEMSIDTSKKIDYIKKELGNIDYLTNYHITNELVEYNIQNYHFLDLDLDGKQDIIYSGASVSDGNEVVIYLNKIDGYERVFGVKGLVVNLISTFPSVPLTIIVKHCPYSPPDILRNIEIYSPFLDQNGDINYRLSSKISFIEHTVFPSKLTMNKKFIVSNEYYKLRLTPKIDEDSDFFGRDEIKGNTIATYTKGAIGIALSEKEDETGRKWWFVVMLNNSLPKNEMFSTYGSNSTHKYHSLGWMSSHYLKEL